MRDLKAIKTVQPKKPSNLFLVEMIIAMLFFSVSGAVILNVFAAADGKMRRSAAGDSAMLCAQSCAEVYSLKGSAEEMAETVFGEFTARDDGAISIALDESCNPSAEGVMTLIIREAEEDSPAGALRTAELVFMRDDEELRRFTCSAYVPHLPEKEGGAYE